MKDAYLILVHKNDYTFLSLIELLDNEKNDIYIHMDKKIKKLDEKSIKNKVKKSKIYFVERVNCNWGSFSLIKAELNLLKEATRKNYRYYHLISGQDLPIKKQVYIYNYFELNYGKQFISFEKEKFFQLKKVMYYYPFQEIIGRKSAMTSYGRFIRKITVKLQDLFGIIRNKNISFQKGDQWFSITDDFAKYIVSREDEIEKIFKNTYCSDEIFVQTLLINSDFKDRVYSYDYDNAEETIKRYIDWNRGNPYVWRSQDFKELVESDALFARKFDSNIDKEIIDKIKEYVSK